MRSESLQSLSAVSTTVAEQYERLPYPYNGHRFLDSVIGCSLAELNHFLYGGFFFVFFVVEVLDHNLNLDLNVSLFRCAIAFQYCVPLLKFQEQHDVNVLISLVIFWLIALNEFSSD